VDGEQRDRIAENERLLRAANEEIELEARDDAGGRDALDRECEFFCTCGRPSCDETLLLTIGEYERAHASGARFIVVPGHHSAEIERVVERFAAFEVVEKLPEYTDPRPE
jgi:hypothetical protein